MAKCKLCGRHGLFTRVDEYGLCRRCASLMRRENQALSSLHSQISQAQSRLSQLNSQIAAAEKSLDAARAKADKLLSLAKSIQYSSDNWVHGNFSDASVKSVLALSFDELLPAHDLKCLSTKQLRARASSVRKQIVDLCTSYESEYRRVNSAVYKLIVLYLESGLDAILQKLSFGKLDDALTAVRALTANCYAIASETNAKMAPTLKRFLGQIESLYLDTVEIEYEYYVQRERAREQQRAIKEQMRQEAEERKRLEHERKKVDSEEAKYKSELERLAQKLAAASAADSAALTARISELEAQLSSVEARKSEIINLQNGKAGTVYIISNLGAFGDHVFKIGMTRRLDPQDRIDELGSASVPFPFDVHSFIFSDDAVALESALHRELNDRRVNKVNLRKEFFDISLPELQSLVERIDPTAPFHTTFLAEQYNQSQSIASVPYQTAVADDEDPAAV